MADHRGSAQGAVERGVSALSSECSCRCSLLDRSAVAVWQTVLPSCRLLRVSPPSLSRSRADEPLAKGGLNGGHRPPPPCELPMGGFPCEFGPETGR